VKVGPILGRLAVAAPLVLAACSHGPRAPDPVQQFVAERVQRARAFEYQGDLAGAREQWEMLRALRPQDTELQAQLVALRQRMARRAQAHLREAERLWNAGDLEGARARWLAAQALDPGRSQAIGALRRLEIQHIRKAQWGRLKRFGGRRVNPTTVLTEALAGPPANE